MPLRALLLEDSPEDVELILENLRSAGFSVEADAAETEEQFVALLRERGYHVILSDFNLPGYNAFGALKAAMEYCPDVPFICVSGAVGEETAVELLKQGAEDYVLKDRLTRLPFAVRRALDRVEERKRRLEAEEALRESEAKFRTVADTAQAAIFIYQGEHFAWVNRCSEKLTGYSSEELLEMKFWELVHPEDRDMVRERGLARQRGETVPNRYEFRILTKSGETRWLDFTAGVISYKGTPAGLGTAFDITDRKRTEAELQKTVHEKTMLLKEVHHRVKNSLQIVNSLINLQAVRLQNQEAVAALNETGNRIMAMALLHDALYRSGVMSAVQVRPYFEGVCNAIVRSYGIQAARIALRRRIDDLTMNIDQAIACGLIINELVSNAVKYAFPSGSGVIEIELVQRENQFVEMTVSDNGVGLPDDVPFDGTASLGMKLVSLLTQQLNGSMEVIRDGGTTFRFSFKLKKE